MSAARNLNHLEIRIYEGHEVTYNDDGWFNATQASAKWNKIPNEWLRLDSTSAYIAALKRKYGNFPYLKTVRGNSGGTWLHPKLAVAFARWLDDDFAVWCDAQIDELIHGKQNWAQQRHASVASAKVMAMMLDDYRKEAGKTTLGHHYSNEHLMINKLVTGERKGIDRDGASVDQLDVLAALQIKNAILIGKGVQHHDRQVKLAADVKTLPSYHRLAIAPSLTSKEATKNRKRPAANDPDATV